MGNVLMLLGGFAVVAVIAVIAIYVWTAVVYQKVLKHLGYKNPWMAWIPYVNNYAVADVIRGDNDKTNVLGLELPYMLFNFWWLIGIVITRIPNVGSILYLALQIICLGTCFKTIYAKCEQKDPSEVAALAYVSGFIPIIALIKFTAYKFDK